MIIDKWDQGGVDRLSQVVDKGDEQHYKGQVKRDWLL